MSKRQHSNVKLWNTMMYAFAINGDADNAKRIFFRIIKDPRLRLRADANTFVLVVNAMSGLMWPNKSEVCFICSKPWQLYLHSLSV